MRGLKIALCVMVFLMALGLTLYPFISNYYAEMHQSTAIAGYTAAVSSMDNYTLYNAWQAADEYNRSIEAIAMDGLNAIQSLNTAPDNYEEYLNVNGDGIMGYIRIPLIDIALPIYHGVEGDTLELGVGHLPGSSLPVGGTGTHTVLAAHSGLASQRMFSDLEQLQEGDRFYLNVLGDTMSYEVDQILVVKPDDATALGLDKVHDYVTLITCTPFGVNSHRLLVRGHRVPNLIEDADPTDIKVDPAPSTWREQYKKGVLTGLGILGGCVIVPAIVWKIYRIRHPRRRYKHEKI